MLVRICARILVPAYAIIKIMRHRNCIVSASASYMLAALSLTASYPSNLLAATLEVENWRQVNSHANAQMPISVRMDFMEFHKPKRLKKVDAEISAQPSESNEDASEIKKKETGCYVRDAWYPEGAIYPPQEPGKITGTVVTYVCRGGKWIISSKAN